MKKIINIFIFIQQYKTYIINKNFRRTILSFDTNNLQRSFSYFRTIIQRIIRIFFLVVYKVIGDTRFRTYRNTIYSYNMYLNYKFILF